MLGDFLRRWIVGRPEDAPPGRARIAIAEPPEVLYAIGDVHGRLDLLTALEADIAADAAGVTGRRLIVMLGDYVDRGPQSAQVLDHLLDPPPAGFERICLAGNHEAMMLAALDDPAVIDPWLANGGLATLASYGVSIEEVSVLGGRHRALDHLLSAVVPAEHRSLMAGLPVMLQTPGFVFVHAGLRPGVAIEAQHEEDLLWIRSAFLDSAGDFGLTVVHGHTPVPEPEITGRRIGLDTGAFATGRLSAARIGPGGFERILATAPD